MSLDYEVERKLSMTEEGARSLKVVNTQIRMQSVEAELRKVVVALLKNPMPEGKEGTTEEWRAYEDSFRVAMEFQALISELIGLNIEQGKLK